MAAKPHNKNYDTWVIHRILSRSIVSESGCIEYQGNWKHKYGLISITVDGVRKCQPAHRAMYIAVNKAWYLPHLIFIRHKCDNPRCVNIEHLEPGTAKDNMQDAITRGGKRPGLMKYKLHTRQRVHSDDKIRAIRVATGAQKNIAWEYGVSIGYVSKIKSGKAKTLVV